MWRLRIADFNSLGKVWRSNTPKPITPVFIGCRIRILGAGGQLFVEIENLADVFLELGAVERVEPELRFGRVNVSDVLLSSRGSGSRLSGCT
jgi:hypothetical protein